MSPTRRRAGADGVPERAVEGGGVFRRIGHDLHVEEAGLVEAFADGGDAPVHHVGGGDDVGAGLGLEHGLADQERDRLVVEDPLALHHAVMAVAGIGVEGDVA